MFESDYRRTGFKCYNLLNANANFFLSSQKLERNSFITDNYVIVTRAVPEWLHYSDVKATWKVVIASVAAVFPVPDEPTTMFEAYQQADCRGGWPTTMLSFETATALGSFSLFSSCSRSVSPT